MRLCDARSWSPRCDQSDSVQSAMDAQCWSLLAGVTAS
jgi:hypothetical protein